KKALSALLDSMVGILSYSGKYIMNEKIVIGRCDEDIILPCSFESGPEIVIHWNIKDKNNVHSYYKGTDHLETQDPRYANRTSLFHSEIHNGNASLSVSRLSLLDEGIYTCYVGTTTKYITNKVVLKVGAFHTPVMMYEKRNTSSFLVCSMPSVYPRPHITWKRDNTFVPESKTEEIGYLGPFHINSTINITESNSSYECAIENSLLNQTWIGRWTLADGFYKMQSEQISLSCQVIISSLLQNQDFSVTWSRVESQTSHDLAWYLSSSQNTIINEPRFSWNKELVNQSDFSMTLTDLTPSDSGEYLCIVSSSKYTLLTIHRLHVGKLQVALDNGFALWIIIVSTVSILLLLILSIICISQRCSNVSRGNMENLALPLGVPCLVY
uniref:Ig-like domain-containing protein n=1 Tax=Castor canadensis TaxID=51338 RepID=A0A8C0WRH9_CASCN